MDDDPRPPYNDDGPDPDDDGYERIQEMLDTPAQPAAEVREVQPDPEPLYSIELERIIDERAEALGLLNRLVGWLDGSEMFLTVHGAHSDTIEAQAFLRRVEGG